MTDRAMFTGAGHLTGIGSHAAPDVASVLTRASDSDVLQAHRPSPPPAAVVVYVKKGCFFCAQRAAHARALGTPSSAVVVESWPEISEPSLSAGQVNSSASSSARAQVLRRGGRVSTRGWGLSAAQGASPPLEVGVRGAGAEHRANPAREKRGRVSRQRRAPAHYRHQANTAERSAARRTRQR